MKRCPNCSRSYPDDNQKFCTVDGGLLVTADKPFDPNATIQSTSLNAGTPSPELPKASASTPQPDFGATIATPSSAPTVVLPKKTGPTGSPTSSNLQPKPSPPPSQASMPPPPPQKSVPPAPAAGAPMAPRAPSAPLPRPAPPLPQSSTALPIPVPPPKKSKLPLILGILGVLFILGVVAVVAAFFLVIKPRLDEMNDRPVVISQTENPNNPPPPNTEPTKPPSENTANEFVAPPNTTQFANSSANLDGKLAEHYFDFSFYYPDSWVVDPKAGVPGASNFAKVERRLPPDYTQENFAVGWYTSKGTFAADEATFPQLVEVLGTNLSKGFPDYRKVSEGPTKVNSLDAYEFRFESVSKGSEKGDIQLWGRVIFVPTGVAGDQSGATLVMLATSLAPELSGVEDVGVKGEMPVILESFRFAKAP